MHWRIANSASILWLLLVALAIAQQPSQPQPPQPQPPQPAEPQRIEARKEVIVNWTLGDQAWNFRDVLSTYEPVKGYLESHGNEGFIAVWKVKLIRELEPGAAKHHEEMLGSPFKVVLLDADRTVVDSDAPAQITTPVGAKADDTIELRVGLDAQSLKTTKVIRVQRRTEVGFY
jgi:hypothetical protein